MTPQVENTMNRATLVVTASLIFAAFAAPAHAQVGWYGGVTGGVSSAKVSGDRALDSSSRNGMIAGAFASYNFTGYSAITLEGNWASYGGREVRLGGSGLPSEPVDLSLSQVELPLLLSAFRPISDAVRIGFSFGVTMGFNLSCKAQVGGDPETDCADSELDVEASSVTFAVPAGLGLGYELANGSILMLDARYALGVSGAFTTPLSGVKNRAWQFTGKWHFPLSR
jgi:hypothetical protein